MSEAVPPAVPPAAAPAAEATKEPSKDDPSKPPSKPKISGPVDVGMGRHQYTVHGTKFEVPKKYKLTKAVGFGVFSLLIFYHYVGTMSHFKLQVSHHILVF